MKRSSWIVIALLAIMVVSISGLAQAQDSPQGTYHRSTQHRRLEAGHGAHASVHCQAEDGIDSTNYPPNAETAGSIACIYGVTAPTSGCPKSGSPVATGGAQSHCRG